MTIARTKLKSAAAAVALLSEEIAQLEISLARSKEIAGEAEAELSSYSKLDKQISKFRAEAVKAGRDPRRMPDELKRQSAARKEAQDELERSLETVEVLSKELGDAKAHLNRLQRAHADCGSGMLREYVAELGVELATLEKRRWELRQYIEGCYHAVGIFTDTSNALKGYAIEGFPAALNPSVVMAQRWLVQLKVLLADADAPVELPKLVLPEDYFSSTAVRSDAPPRLVFLPR